MQNAHHSAVKVTQAIPWRPGLALLGAIATPGICALTRAFTPNEPNREEEKFQQLADAVSDKIKLMPAYFTAVFLCLTITFDWFALLRFGRRSRSLSPAEIEHYISEWEHSRLRTLGQLVLFYRRIVPFIYYSTPPISGPIT